MFRQLRHAASRFVSLLLCYHFLPIFSSLVLAQSAPNFALKITRTIATPDGNSNVTEWYYSDDGAFTVPVSVSWQGLVDEQLSDTRETTGFSIWIRSEPDFFPSGGAVQVARAVLGSMQATRPVGSHLMSRVSGPTEYGYTGWDCQTLFGPDLWSACAPENGTTTNAINYQDQTSSNTGTAQTGVVEGYPGTPYRTAGAGAALDHHLRMRCNPQGGSCTEPAISGSVESTTSVVVSIGPRPEYQFQPGGMPGPAESFQCGGNSNDSDSAPGGGGDDGLGSSPGALGSLNLATGNFMLMLEDPVRTRGLPLRNRIFINSQAVDLNRPMGNASFTYDIHVYSPSMPGQTNWMVVDGDGKRLDYGTGQTPIGAPGNFAALAETQDGFSLSSSGAPEDLRSAGNYNYTFDTEGKLLSVTDPAGNIQTVSYTDGKISEVLDVSSNKSLSFGWTNNRITSVTENGGAETILQYTSGGLLQTVTLQDSAFGVARSVGFTYAPDSRLVSYTRDNDPTSTYTLVYWYSPNGVPRARIWGRGRSVMPLYDAYTGGDPHARVILPNSKGGNTIYDFNSNFDVTRIFYPALAGSSSGATFSFGYDGGRNLSSWSDGATTRTFEYEANGFLKKINRTDGTYLQYNWTNADLQSIVDSLGTIGTFSYTNPLLPHVPTSYTDGAGNAWTLSRNDFGQLTEILPPTGAELGSISLTYDESQASSSYGWLTKIADALGNERRFDAFNAKGQVTSVSTDPDPSTPSTRITESRAFDAAGRLRNLTHADGKAVVFSYTGRNLSYFDDEALTRTEFTYCVSCDALQTESKPLGHLLRWDTDIDLQETKFTDARLHYTAYVYGQSKELTTESYPDLSINYLYDGSYRLRLRTNGRAQDTEYSYDTLGRLHEVSYPTTGETAHTITYRADDSLLSFTDAAGTTTREYFNNRLLKAEVFSYSGLSATQRVEYEYYPDNLLKKITWKNGAQTVGTWVYTYDAAGRMESVTSFNQTNSFVYDGEGKLLTQNNHNGTSIHYVWNDERSWLNSITHKKLTTPFASYTLEYDNSLNTVGNLSEVTELAGDVMSFGYDALYRLNSETRTGGNAYTKGYEYDLAANLVTLNGAGFATYDGANKISSLSGGTISHDGDGNITGVSGAGIPNSTLSWNTRSRLSSLSSGTSQVNFTYDTLGRRVLQVQGTVKRFYIFAGDKLLGEIQASSPQVAYTWGPDGLVSERLFRVHYIGTAETSAESIPQVEDESGLSGYATEISQSPSIEPIPISDITLWYHFGAQGETRYLTNLSGNITDTYLYDAYGIPIFATGTFYNPHRYGGKYGYHSNLNPTGLVLAGHRWYSPQLRRWMSRDPISYEGGENLYAYVRGRPVKYLDPSGLAEIRYTGTYIIPGHVWIQFNDGTTVGFWAPWWPNPFNWGPSLRFPDPRGQDPNFRVGRFNYDPGFESHLKQCINDSAQDLPMFTGPYNCKSWAEDMWQCAYNRWNPIFINR